MDTVYLVLLVLGALSFLGAAAGRATVAGSDGGAARRGGVAAFGLLPLGLFFWILVPVIQYARVVF